MRTTPRAPNICTRPSPPSSLRPLVNPEPSPMAPIALSPSVFLSPATPSIHLSSQPVYPPPFLPAPALAPASSLEVKPPETEDTEGLPVCEIPECGGEPTPLPLSPKPDFKPASREATSPSPKHSQGACTTSEVYVSLLRPHGVETAAIKEASLEDLRILARLFTSLSESKSFRESPQ